VQLANSNHAPERVAQSCRETLAELRLEYLDLFLVHWPVVSGNKGPQVEPPIKVRACTRPLHS
jgi:diketogulonate reductase-like aldo/keto reductase